MAAAGIDATDLFFFGLNALQIFRARADMLWCHFQGFFSVTALDNLKRNTLAVLAAICVCPFQFDSRFLRLFADRNADQPAIDPGRLYGVLEKGNVVLLKTGFQAACIEFRSAQIQFNNRHLAVGYLGRGKSGNSIRGVGCGFIACRSTPGQHRTDCANHQQNGNNLQ